MAGLWACACGALNKPGDRRCEACGKARSEGVRTEPQQPTPNPDDRRCSWITEGRRCYMSGSIGAKHAHCTWHDAVAAHGRLAEEYDEFERWVTAMVEAKYCSEWTHDRAHELWRAVRGESLLPAYPSACLQAGCRYRDVAPVDRVEALTTLRKIGMHARLAEREGAEV